MTAQARNGVYLVITIVALVVAVYFALQLLALILKLVFLLLAAFVAIAAYRAWREAG